MEDEEEERGREGDEVCPKDKGLGIQYQKARKHVDLKRKQDRKIRDKK